ncbi:hypothetical protein MNBD_GAMMA04-1726 [hydrothermal vent metagenome]|uniref:Thioredoxin domain-containing protein n=1 Tax=hydrothermal vent metagenome TaxID=652676 RepID=A0A3B0VZN1_9ZZZZ
MAVHHLKHSQFETFVPENDLIIFSFWASWSAPCTLFSDTFERLSQKFTDAAFCQINVEEEETLAELFQVRSIPTILFMREGIIVFSHAGVIAEEALEEGIQDLQQLDMTQVHQDLLRMKNA